MLKGVKRHQDEPKRIDRYEVVLEGYCDIPEETRNEFRR